MTEVAKDLKGQTGTRTAPQVPSLSSLNLPLAPENDQLAMNLPETKRVPQHVTDTINRLNKKLQNDFHGKSRLSFAQGERVEEIVLRIDSKILVKGFPFFSKDEALENKIYNLSAQIQNAEQDNKIKIFLPAKGDSIKLEVAGIPIPKEYDPRSYDIFRLGKIVEFIERRKGAYPPVKIEIASNLLSGNKDNFSVGSIDIGTDYDTRFHPDIRGTPSYKTYAAIKYAETHGIVPRLVMIEKDYVEFDICYRRILADGRSTLYPVSERFSVKKGTSLDNQYYDRRDRAIAEALGDSKVRSLIEENVKQKINLAEWDLQAVSAQSRRRGDLGRSQNISFSLPRNEPYGLNPNYPNGEYGVCSAQCHLITALAHNRIELGTWASVEETAVRIIRSHSAVSTENPDKYGLRSYSLPEKVKINNEFLPITAERVLREIASAVNNLNIKGEYIQLDLTGKIQKNREKSADLLNAFEEHPEFFMRSEDQLRNTIIEFGGLYSFEVTKFKYDSETNSKVVDSRNHAILLFLDNNNKIMVYDPNGDGQPAQASIKPLAEGRISLEYKINLPDGTSKSEKWDTYIYPSFRKPSDQVAEATQLRRY